jgi:hypothetical protein
MTPTLQPSEIFTKAADHIRDHGWCRHDMGRDVETGVVYDPDEVATRGQQKRPCATCVAGAICYVTAEPDTSQLKYIFVALRQANAAAVISGSMGWRPADAILSITHWNDHLCKSAEEAEQFLRRAAAAAD